MVHISAASSFLALLPFLGVSSLNFGPLATAAFFLARLSARQPGLNHVSQRADLLPPEARTIRPNMGVVYASVAPHRVPESAKVSGAPILRIPYGAHQLVGVIRGLGRRVLDNALAA